LRSPPWTTFFPYTTLFRSIGMGRDLAEQFPVAADLFRQADEILGQNLSEIAWSGPIEELTKTSNCQPALYVHGLACLVALRELADRKSTRLNSSHVAISYA